MRTFGRTGWQVSEVGHGMRGMGDWSGSEDEKSLNALERSFKLGCNFYDSAWVYGSSSADRSRRPGRSDRLLGELVYKHRDQTLYTASKIPPKDFSWPAKRGVALEDTYSRDHVLARADEIREHTGLETLDLLQFHTWDDNMCRDPQWERIVGDLKDRHYCRAVGISLNTFDASNGIEAVRTGAIDSVQVVYNVFTRDAEDGLFEACADSDVAVIARVPFDEGSLTGALTARSSFPAGDFRASYFGGTKLASTIERIDRLRELVPEGMTMAQMSLAFVLAEPAVSTVIPGMRAAGHVDENVGAAKIRLSGSLMAELKKFRWERTRRGLSRTILEGSRTNR